MLERHAIISDIHGNLEALRAVFADIETLDIDEIICLGDIVGYGPRPLECLRELEKFYITIKGNHELALAEGCERFNQRASRAIDWTLEQLNSTADGRDFLEHIDNLPKSHTEEGILYVHGSPQKPTSEYLLPLLSNHPDKLAPQFDMFDRYCFVGHTHVPGVFELGKPFVTPEDMFKSIFIMEKTSKAIVNVGSVGQPRDRDPRACYVIFDGDSVVFRRVEYDIEKTRQEIHAQPLLDNILGDRLVDGR
ncbi:MAG: metallophosphoesterase family protein [Planctomycetes bacterium]|nr:metallophosphoesterase family protein [Planctomycetota bacterium]